MTNFVQKGDVLNVTCTNPTTPASGDPVRLGNITGVACEDEVTAGTTVVHVGDGVFDLSVKGVNDLGNSAVAAGDAIYYVDADTPKLSKKSSGYFFGYALETVGSGSTATINVLHVESPGPASAGHPIQTADLTITTGQLLALYTTPQTIVASPGAGLAIVPVGLVAFLDYNSAAYDGIAAGEDITLKYTNGSGTVLFTLEATGFLDQTSDQTRYQAGPATILTPTADAAVVVHMASGNIATGDSPLKLRFYYMVVPTAL